MENSCHVEFYDTVFGLANIEIIDLRETSHILGFSENDVLRM